MHVTLHHRPPSPPFIHPQARQDLESVKNIAGAAAKTLGGMASRFMSDLSRY
jgi:hypothetical protein